MTTDQNGPQMPDRPQRSMKARPYTASDPVTETLFRVGCATPGLHCQEYPIYLPTFEAAREKARSHAEDREHVSNIRRVQTMPLEVWAAIEPDEREPS